MKIYRISRVSNVQHILTYKGDYGTRYGRLFFSRRRGDVVLTARSRGVIAQLPFCVNTSYGDLCTRELTLLFSGA